MRGITAEQLLLIADEFCLAFGVGVKNFAALSAAAAVSNARFSGVPVFDSATAMATEVAATVEQLEPLTAKNDLFAALTSKVLLSLNA